MLYYLGVVTDVEIKKNIYKKFRYEGKGMVNGRVSIQNWPLPDI